MMALVAVLALASMLYLARKLRNPYKKPTRLQSLFETLIQYMRDTVYQPVLGDEGKRFHMLCFSFFLFILYGNLLGMVPLRPAAPQRGSPGLAGRRGHGQPRHHGPGLITFVVLQRGRDARQGILGYGKVWRRTGHPAAWPPLRSSLSGGDVSKTIALIMRLFANMIGGHVAIILILLLS